MTLNIWTSWLKKKQPKADLFDIKCKQVFEKWKYHMRNEKSEH